MHNQTQKYEIKHLTMWRFQFRYWNNLCLFVSQVTFGILFFDVISLMIRLTLSTTTSCEIRNCTTIYNKNLRNLTRDEFKHTSKWSKIECMSFQDDVFHSIETALFSNFRSLRILHMKNIPVLGKGIISGFEDINKTKLTQLCLENVNLTTAVVVPWLPNLINV